MTDPKTAPTTPERNWLLVAGRYALAISAISGLVAAIWVIAIAAALAPLHAALVEERIARQKADEVIAFRFMLVGRDRIDLIDIMSTASLKDRERKAAMVREKWAREEAELSQQIGGKP